MKIQFGHARSENFKTDFYTPLKVNFPQIDWIFPHEIENTSIDSQQSLKEVDIFIAEVSFSSIGLGIELGFAKIYDTRIICMYKSGIDISSSLHYITDEFIEYSSENDMIEKLSKVLTPSKIK